MLSHKNIFSTVSLFLFFVLTFARPAQADVSGWHNNFRHNHNPYRTPQVYFRPHHPYPHQGQRVVVLPRGVITIVIGGSRYFYGDGVFYHRETDGYDVVVPPAGVIVDAIPARCAKVVIYGKTYYRDNSTYYQPSPHGFVIVPAPSEHAEVLDSSVKEITINIPNYHQGFTPVVLKKFGDGYLGPQGEFYAQFPSVDQLQVMYAKN